MGHHISQVLDQNQTPQPTLQEILEDYSHIELTQDEINEALLQAKIKKSEKQRIEQQEKQISDRRNLLTQKTNYDIVRGLMEIRSVKKFKPSFLIDDNNRFVFELLCRYFGEDKSFLSMCDGIGVSDPSFKKGIMLCGVFGTGKSWMMKLFSVNQLQCFKIISAKEIAEEYLRDKNGNPDVDVLHKYIVQSQNAFEDPSVFFQKKSGWCIDDIGSEDLKNNYGNKKNVIGDIIEMRYQAGEYGTSLHATTNLTAKQIDDYYGGRVRSRMREMFNFIELPGADRRK